MTDIFGRDILLIEIAAVSIRHPVTRLEARISSTGRFRGRPPEQVSEKSGEQTVDGYLSVMLTAAAVSSSLSAPGVKL
jgi:hypothetical protein